MSKIKSILSALSFFALVLGTAHAQSFPEVKAFSSSKEAFADKELIAPAKLAQMLEEKGGSKIYIYNIGVVEDIKGAKNIGPSSEQEGLERFKKELSSLPKDAAIVYYCGCCPFDRCPNIRPAHKLVKSMGFTNARLLNLPVNVKTDWMDAGYPMKGAK